jgi:hypothetical protein
MKGSAFHLTLVFFVILVGITRLFAAALGVIAAAHGRLSSSPCPVIGQGVFACFGARPDKSGLRVGSTLSGLKGKNSGLNSCVMRT